MNAERINDTQCTDFMPDEAPQTVDEQCVAQSQDPQKPATEPINKTGTPPSSRPPLLSTPKRREYIDDPTGSAQGLMLKPSQQDSYANIKLNSFREKVARYISSVPTLTLDQLRENVLPRTLSTEQVQAVLAEIDVEAMKKSFPVGDPTKSKRTPQDIPRGGVKTSVTEPEDFLHIKDALEQVLTVGERVLKVTPQARISYKPYSTPVSSERSNTTRPDCNIVLTQSTSLSGPPVDAYCDFITTMEVRPKATCASVYENRCQVLYSLRHIMRDDPCRRFCYGITIEGKTTRVWFACRAGIFASDPFDYTENTTMLLETFVRMCFSSKTDLGWDESMERKGACDYRIRVGDEWYDTEKVICNISSEEIEGWATRVWTAFDKNKNRVVVKDVWLDVGRKQEHVILEELLASEKDGEMLDLVTKYIFTTVGSGIVKIGDAVDDTRNLILNGLRPTKGLPFILVNDEPEGAFSEGLRSGGTAGYSSKPSRSKTVNGINIQHRYHYRIVFKEVGTPLYNVRSLEGIFRACYHAMIVMSYLAGRKLAHRDISTANIYLYGDRGIVSDFEYMKGMSENAGSDRRTDTPGCMAVEVENEEYLFENQDEVKADDDDDDEEVLPLKELMRGGVPKVSIKSEDDGSTAFCHNPIHDAESLWWICVMVVFKMRVVLSDGTKLDNTNFAEQTSTASKIFPSVSANIKRQHFLRSNGVFKEYMNTLHPSLSKIVEVLRKIRSQLLKMYRATEKNLPVTMPLAYNYKKLYRIAALFYSGAQETEGMTLEDFPQEWVDALPWNSQRFKGVKRSSASQSENRRHSKFRRCEPSTSKVPEGHPL